MLYGDTIQETRQVYFSSWKKYQQKLPLSPLEHEVVQVIINHPEYHQLLEHPEKFQEHAWYPELGETNPFLHLGLHIAVREQITLNRPMGMDVAYKNIINKYNDPHKVEHLMMEQLAECLWLSQKNNQPPDEQHYLNALDDL